MKRYPKYKDSGVEWIGEIPAHWEVKRLKVLTESVVNGVWGDEPKGNINDIICIRVADFDFQNLNISDEKLTYRNIVLGEDDKRLLHYGDLLIEKSGGGDIYPVGRVVQFNLNDRAVSSNFIGKLAASHNLVTSDYLLLINKFLYDNGVNARSIKQTTGIQNLDIESYLDELIALPPINEQHTIAMFISGRTKEVQQFITNKQKLITLLREERTALINQAVTKGINPKAKMKPSGIEWLGDIPAHWEVKKLKYLVDQFGRIGFRGYTIDDMVEYGQGAISLSPGNIINNKFDLSVTNFITMEKYIESPEIQIFPNDLIFVKTGSTYGKVALVDNHPFPLTLNPQMVVFKNIKINVIYLYYVLTTPFVKIQLDNSVIGGAAPTVSQEKIGNLSIAFPDSNEQQIIVSYIQTKTTQIDQTITRIEREIELLREYRTALISEVVTGKVCVI